MTRIDIILARALYNKLDKEGTKLGVVPAIGTATAALFPEWQALHEEGENKIIEAVEVYKANPNVESKTQLDYANLDYFVTLCDFLHGIAYKVKQNEHD